MGVSFFTRLIAVGLLTALCLLASCSNNGGEPDPQDELFPRLALYSDHAYGGPDGRVIIKEGSQLSCYSGQLDPLWQHGELEPGSRDNAFFADESAIYSFTDHRALEKLSFDGAVQWSTEPLEHPAGLLIDAPLLVPGPAGSGLMYCAQGLRSGGAATGIPEKTVVSALSTAGQLQWQTELPAGRVAALFPLAEGMLAVSYDNSMQPSVILSAQGVVTEPAGKAPRIVAALPADSGSSLVTDSASAAVIRYGAALQELWRADTHPFFIVESNRLFPAGSGFISTAHFADFTAYDAGGDELWSWNSSESVADGASSSQATDGSLYIVDYYFADTGSIHNIAMLQCIGADGSEVWSSPLPEALERGEEGGRLRSSSASERVFVSDGLGLWVFSSSGVRLAYRAAQSYALLPASALP